MLTVKYKQRLMQLQKEAEDFINIEQHNTNVVDAQSTAIKSNDKKDKVVVKKLLKRIMHSATQTDNKNVDTESNKDIENLQEQLKQTKIALRETTGLLRQKECKRLSEVSNIPRPVVEKSKDPYYERMYELCQHLLVQFEDKSVVIRQTLMEKIKLMFGDLVIKTSPYSPALDEYLSQQDVTLIQCKIKSFRVFGLFSGNILIKTNLATRLTNIKYLLRQIACEWHVNKSILYVLNKLQPRRLMVLKNGDYKLSFDHDFVYIYSNGVIYYEDGGSVYLYPDCELKIINGDTFCTFDDV